jgi:hypothetical protein
MKAFTSKHLLQSKILKMMRQYTLLQIILVARRVYDKIISRIEVKHETRIILLIFIKI